MVIFIWGLIPLLIPKDLIPFLGLNLTDLQVTLLRLWGVVVLLDTFVYFYIFRNPNKNLTKYLLIFSVLDNAGIGFILLILTPIFKLPWGLWINIPFQLFFGYWFYRFYREGDFEDKGTFYVKRT
jgi:Na+-driven multidrug efflux pump